MSILTVFICRRTTLHTICFPNINLLFFRRIMTVGDSARLSKTFTREDVTQFAHLTGDTNPLHLDETYAATTKFGSCIVHGVLLNSLLSALMGTKFPGTGTIYRSQLINFKSPLYINETCTAVVTVASISGRYVTLTTELFAPDRGNQLIADGESHVVVPKSLIQTDDS